MKSDFKKRFKKTALINQDMNMTFSEYLKNPTFPDKILTQQEIESIFEKVSVYAQEQEMMDFVIEHLTLVLDEKFQIDEGCNCCFYEGIHIDWKFNVLNPRTGLRGRFWMYSQQQAEIGLTFDEPYYHLFHPDGKRYVVKS